MIKQELLRKIDSREITVGVIGLGYVGLPLSVEKAKAGFKVKGFDINPDRVRQVNNGCNYIGDVVDSELSSLVETGMLSATSDFMFVKDVQFIAICVPTPLDSHKQPNMTYVRQSAEMVAKNLEKGSVVVLESTTYPGTTEDLVKPILEKGSGLKCGEDFYLGFSPERVDPGNKIYNTKNTPKVVGAIGNDALEVISRMYGAVLDGDIHKVSSPAVAEMEKLLENMYRNINIAMVNELAMLCNIMKINIWEVIEAAKTKPYGFQAFYPGPGLGGHCIPLDPYYLSWKAREYGFHTSMLETASMINDGMPEYCVNRIARILNRYKKPLNGAKILILGVAYKQDVSDYRESPALRVISALEKQGCEVSYYDLYVPECVFEGINRKSLTELTHLHINQYDIIAVTAAHTTIDYDMVADAGVPVFDTKNAMKNVRNRANVETL